MRLNGVNARAANAHAACSLRPGFSWVAAGRCIKCIGVLRKNRKLPLRVFPVRMKRVSFMLMLQHSSEGGGPLHLTFRGSSLQLKSMHRHAACSEPWETRKAT